MSESQAPDLENNAVYLKASERAAANKPPSRSNPIGAVAHTRAPGLDDRQEMAAQIAAEDNALQQGHFGTIYYKPVTVGQVEMKLEPIQPAIGTIVHGLDVEKDLEDPAVSTYLRNLWLERKVIMFRGQDHLTPHQMVEFARHFGEVGVRYGEPGHEPNSPHDMSHPITVPGIPDMLVLISDEKAPGAASAWHADATWQQRPPMGSVLMCREAPPIGGDTCFCDCHGMWESLSKETKNKVENLTAVHVGGIIHQMDGKTPTAIHPVARTHPETGKTVLYVQQGFVKGFAEAHNLPESEARAMLLEMKLLEGRPEYTCRFRWEPGSIAIWDNRSVLHSASADFWPHRRRMERLTILDPDESRRTPYYAPSSP